MLCASVIIQYKYNRKAPFVKKYYKYPFTKTKSSNNSYLISKWNTKHYSNAKGKRCGELKCILLAGKTMDEASDKYIFIGAEKKKAKKKACF